MVAVTNGVSEEDHRIPQDSIRNCFPVTASLASSIDETPIGALDRATNHLQAAGSVQDKARRKVIQCVTLADSERSPEDVEIAHFDVNDATEKYTDRINEFDTFRRMERVYVELMDYMRKEHHSLSFFVGGDNIIATTPDHAALWAESFYRGYDPKHDGWLTIFSAPLFDSGRTRSELGLAMNNPGWPTVFLRKIRDETVELQDDANLYREGDVLRRVANILERWDNNRRRDWAERTTNTRYGDWVTVVETETPIAHLKLLCHAKSGNPTLTLDDHYEGDVSARVTPELAAESITEAIQIIRRIRDAT